jgi:hypothetical protein
MSSKNPGNRELLRLLKEIDEEGTNLTRSQIDFVAELIDGSVSDFDPAQARRIQRLHHKKVVNGRPEYD